VSNIFGQGCTSHIRIFTIQSGSAYIFKCSLHDVYHALKPHM